MHVHDFGISYVSAKGKRVVPSAKAKAIVYEEISKALDGVGPVKRLPAEIKRKKECWISNVKKKA